jgi:hypothetical protein
MYCGLRQIAPSQKSSFLPQYAWHYFTFMSCGHPSTRIHVYYHNPCPRQKRLSCTTLLDEHSENPPAPMLLQSLSFNRFIPHSHSAPAVPASFHSLHVHATSPPGHHVLFIFYGYGVRPSWCHRALSISLIPSSFGS